MGCPDENELLALVEGVARRDSLATIEDHLDTCVTCRRLVSALLAASSLQTPGDRMPACATTTPTSAAPVFDAIPDSISVPAGVSPRADVATRYRVVETLGAGAMGVVYGALDDQLGREVAIKILRLSDGVKPPDPSQSADVAWAQRARFLREARLTGRLDHPNIVSVYEIGHTEAGGLYYAMKRVRGRTLSAAIAACASLSERLRLVGHVRDICHAIAYAHSRGVVHRDLKPGNMMIGEYGETVLLDLGLAKRKGEEVDFDRAQQQQQPQQPQQQEADARTMAGTALGTPSYMSPEQAEGRVDDIDEASDIFSLGAIVYEILSGRPPYAGADALSLARRAEITPVRAICADAPAELCSICHKALAPKKSERYVSAAALAADLDAFLLGNRVSTHAYSLSQHVRRFFATHRLTAAVGAVSLVAIAVILGASYSGILAERNQALANLGRANVAAARLALEKGDLPTARVQARAALLVSDSLSARAVWARLAREPLRWQRSLPSYALSLAFSPAQASFPPLLVAASGNGSLYMMKEDSGVVRIVRAHDAPPTALAFAPDGAWLASGGYDHIVNLWDMEKNSARARLAACKAVVTGLASSPDGASLAVACDDGGLGLWSSNGEKRGEWNAHAQGLTKAAWCASGELVSGGRDRVLRVWDATSTTPRHVIELDGEVFGLAAAEHGPLVVATTTAGSVWLCDVATGMSRRLAQQHDGPAIGAAFQVGRERLGPQCVASWGKDGVVLMHDAASGQLLRRFTGSEPVWGGAFSPDGRLFAAASRDASLRLWDVRIEPAPLPWRGHDMVISASAESPDSSVIASASADRTVRLWDGESGQLIHTLRGHVDTVRAVAFDPAGNQIASVGSDGVVFIWDRASGKTRRELHPGPALYAVAFDPEGGLLAAGARDGTIRMAQLPAGDSLPPLRGLADRVKWLAFSRDGKWLAASDATGALRLWHHPHTGAPQLAREEGPGGRPLAFVDGNRLAFVGKGDKLWVWDLSSAQEAPLAPACADADSLSVSDDGARTAIACANGEVLLFDMPSGRAVVTPVPKEKLSSAQLSLDGRSLIVGDKQGGLNIWSIEAAAPLWRTRALLRSRAGVEVLTHAGFRLLDFRNARVEQGAARERWRGAVVQAQRTAYAYPDTLCVLREDGGIERWSIAADRIAFTAAPVAHVQTLLATQTGCVVEAEGGIVVFAGDEGTRRALCPVSAGAASVSAAGEVVAVCGTEVVAYDSTGAVRSLLANVSGVGAILRSGREGLTLGYADGLVEIVASSERQSLLNPSSSAAVVTLADGPSGALVVGRADGHVELWDTSSRTLLDELKLHGSIDNVLATTPEGGLFLASDRGDYAAVDLKVFTMSKDQLARSVREEAAGLSADWAVGRGPE